MKYFIGIDNGVSGSIGMISEKGEYKFFQKTPTFSVLGYQKTKVKYRTRVNFRELYDLLDLLKSIPFTLGPEDTPPQFKVFIERPMINSLRFQASISASAAFEVTLIVLEELSLPYEYCDSKSWQKLLLPAGCKGPELKRASLEVGHRLFPMIPYNHIDCDGILIAEWARRNNL